MWRGLVAPAPFAPSRPWRQNWPRHVQPQHRLSLPQGLGTLSKQNVDLHKALRSFQTSVPSAGDCAAGRGGVPETAGCSSPPCGPAQPPDSSSTASLSTTSPSTASLSAASPSGSQQQLRAECCWPCSWPFGATSSYLLCYQQVNCSTTGTKASWSNLGFWGDPQPLTPAFREA